MSKCVALYFVKFKEGQQPSGEEITQLLLGLHISGSSVALSKTTDGNHLLTVLADEISYSVLRTLKLFISARAEDIICQYENSDDPMPYAFICVRTGYAVPGKNMDLEKIGELVQDFADDHGSSIDHESFYNGYMFYVISGTNWIGKEEMAEFIRELGEQSYSQPIEIEFFSPR